jgi:murein DD-endopeptidase MepM/ murein hydrolase activator NlpD
MKNFTLTSVVRTLIATATIGFTAGVVMSEKALAGDKLPYDAGYTPNVSFAHGNLYNAIDFGVGNNTNINARASNSGIVVASTFESSGGIHPITGAVCGFGNVVRVRYSNGHYGIYAHLASRAVNVNQTVSQGQVLGVIGTTGCSTGNHLHYERRNSTNIQNLANTYIPSFDERLTSTPWKSQNTGTTTPPAPTSFPYLNLILDRTPPDGVKRCLAVDGSKIGVLAGAEKPVAFPCNPNNPDLRWRLAPITNGFGLLELERIPPSGIKQCLAVDGSKIGVLAGAEKPVAFPCNPNNPDLRWKLY